MTRRDARPDTRKTMPRAFSQARHEDETDVGLVPDEPLITDLGEPHEKTAFNATFDPDRSIENQTPLASQLASGSPRSVRWPEGAEAFVEAWDAAIADWRARGLDQASQNDLRAWARADIRHTLEQLQGASPVVLTEWRKWYPMWARAEAVICLRARLSRMLARHAEAQERLAMRAASTDSQRLRVLADRFVVTMRARGGGLSNDIETIRRAMSTRKPVTPERARSVVAVLQAGYVVKAFGSRLVLLDKAPDLLRLFPNSATQMDVIVEG